MIDNVVLNESCIGLNCTSESMYECITAAFKFGSKMAITYHIKKT